MTDIFECIEAFKAKKAELAREAIKLRSDFEDYISNAEIPLSKRWQTFTKSPDDLKEHFDYFISARTKGLQYVLDNWFDAPEIYGRGKRIYTADLFERVFDDENLNYNPKYVSDEKVALCKEAMEDILMQNCGSFCFDW